jgi:hypothetical protein
VSRDFVALSQLFSSVVVVGSQAHKQAKLADATCDATSDELSRSGSPVSSVSRRVQVEGQVFAFGANSGNSTSTCQQIFVDPG